MPPQGFVPDIPRHKSCAASQRAISTTRTILISRYRAEGRLTFMSFSDGFDSAIITAAFLHLHCAPCEGWDHRLGSRPLPQSASIVPYFATSEAWAFTMARGYGEKNKKGNCKTRQGRLSTAVTFLNHHGVEVLHVRDADELVDVGVVPLIALGRIPLEIFVFFRLHPNRRCDIIPPVFAPVVKLAYTLDSGSSAARCVGSNPTGCTKRILAPSSIG